MTEVTKPKYVIESEPAAAKEGRTWYDVTRNGEAMAFFVYVTSGAVQFFTARDGTTRLSPMFKSRHKADIWLKNLERM